MIYAEIILLIAALSLDSLAAAVSYGLARIKIGIMQSVTISLVCSVFLLVSAAAADIIGEYIPEAFTKIISFLILFIIGLLKLIQKEKTDKPEKLSFAKTVLFAVSMSIDGLAAGFGAGLVTKDSYAEVAVFALLITFITVYLGNIAGLKLNKHAPQFIQKIGGAVIILIAASKLI